MRISKDPLLASTSSSWARSGKPSRMRSSSTLQAPRRIVTLPARHDERSGPNRVRLSPRCGAGETVKPLMRAPDEVPGSCRPAPVLAEPDADPVAVAPDGIELRHRRLPWADRTCIEFGLALGSEKPIFPKSGIGLI